jgi:L-ascorbate metabolism protein UlaG (beta-lactamase superfamily)
MIITWLGHSCFKIESDNTSLVTDPFGPDIGLKLPRNLEASIVTISHAHHDHANIDAVKGDPFVISAPGEYEIKGAFIYGIPSWHDNEEGKERGLNIIYRIEIDDQDDIKVAHLGDLGHKLSTETLEKLGEIDVLFIPVGGKYTLDAKEAVDLVNQIEPRIVIPMHYKVPGLKVDIDSVDKFIKLSGLQHEELPKLKLKKKDLPQDTTKVITLTV